MQYSRAIVKRPGRSLVQGISSAGLGLPDYHLALTQHEGYVQALRDCGLEVRLLEADERYPDSTFLEDPALLTPHCAIILNPGASSRKGETQGLDRILGEYFGTIHAIQDPGTVEGGDILRVEDDYYIGLTARTNLSGAEQLIQILERYGMTGSTVPVKDSLHLKTGLAYLENNTIAATREFLDLALFQEYSVLEVDAEEAYAANCLWINGTVLLPAGFPKTASQVEAAGFPVRLVDVSEFQKLDGGLSCLSLRF